MAIIYPFRIWDSVMVGKEACVVPFLCRAGSARTRYASFPSAEALGFLMLRPRRTPNTLPILKTGIAVRAKSNAGPSTVRSPDPQKTRIEEKAGERFAQDDNQMQVPSTRTRAVRRVLAQDDNLRASY
jgi:hypothetical protein